MTCGGCGEDHEAPECVLDHGGLWVGGESIQQRRWREYTMRPLVPMKFEIEKSDGIPIEIRLSDHMVRAVYSVPVAPRCVSARWIEMPIDRAQSHESCSLDLDHEGPHRSKNGFYWETAEPRVAGPVEVPRAYLVQKPTLWSRLRGLFGKDGR